MAQPEIATVKLQGSPSGHIVATVDGKYLGTLQVSGDQVSILLPAKIVQAIGLIEE